MVFYVSQKGNDCWSGRFAEPERNLKDGPFLTIERALSEIENLKKKNIFPEKGITIEIVEGIYSVINRPIAIGPEHSGNPAGPVVIREMTKKPIFTGGVEIKNWEKCTDDDMKKLPENTRKYIVKSNLKEMGITDFGNFFQPSWAVSEGSYMQLYCNGKPMTIARWPDTGYALTGDIAGKGRFHAGVEKQRLKKWKNEKHLKAYGFWFYEWASQHMEIESVDIDSGTISLKNPDAHSYGYKKGAMFFIYHCLTELDTPGEWYLDVDTGDMYFYPPSDITKAQTIVSMNTQPFFVIKNASNIKIENIVFEHSRKEAIVISDSKNIVVDNCIFRNLGGWAINARNVNNTEIENCEIYNTGEGGIFLEGGDRKTLTPGNNEIINNHIYDYSLWIKIYRPAIQMNGVGNRVANNLIHDAPHMAIGWSGNENIIEYNEIYNVVLETNDAGAIYSGRDPSMQGNIIRYNYFHNIGGIEGHGVASVYLDDGHCGNIVYGNIFYRACVPGKSNFGAVFIHGGRYNIIENNIFIECQQAYNESPWNQERWKKFWTEPPYNERLFGKEIDVRKPPYSTKYPWLVNVLQDMRPNILKKNIVYRCKGFIDRGNQEFIDNLVDADVFEKIDLPYLKFKKDSDVFKIGFESIPAEKIGLKKTRKL
ncbi:MAG TPA: right-handed parallel beta-helix repeat-containing protein [bacterium]|nr:right-handed parallel beta-helix repeat-containing protein [bacterium]HPP09114.1 right-handed parallel beta-helix repeat-containing protein [bacterium]